MLLAGLIWTAIGGVLYTAGSIQQSRIRNNLNKPYTTNRPQVQGKDRQLKSENYYNRRR